MATQIKSFGKSRMTIGSCSEFHNNALDLITKTTPAELHIEALEPAYSQAVGQLAGIVNRQRAYISTAQLADTDKVRDNAVGTISSVVIAYQTTPVEDKRQAAMLLDPQLAAYKGIRKHEYSKETAEIKGMLGVLQAEDNQAAVSLLGLDAEVTALAEANIGEHKEEPSLYFVTISTGVGGALTVGGRLKSTSYEVGHTMMSYRGECHEFEHMCSGTGIVRLAAMNGLNVQSSREFFELKKNGHELAERVYRDWLRLFADWFRMIEETFSPGLFALTGGVMKSQDLFLEDMKAAVPGIRIEPCALGQEAGLLGAAVYGFQNI